MSPLKSIAIALMTLLCTTQAYAMRGDEDGAPRPAAVSPRTQVEQEAFTNAIITAITNTSVQQVNETLIEYEPKNWFTQGAFDWLLTCSAHLSCDPIVEYLLNRTNRFQFSQRCLTDVFMTRTSNPSDPIRLSILYLLAQQDIRHFLLCQPTLENALPRAAFFGRLQMVQCIFALPQDCFYLNDDCRLRTMCSAAFGGQLETVEFLLQHARDNGLLTKRHLNEMVDSAERGYLMFVGNSQYREDYRNKLRGIRDIINCLLNMNELGPDQETVDQIFGYAVQFNPDVRFVEIMLMDRETNALRTGLRPSNRKIRAVQDSIYNPEISAFLNALVLPGEAPVAIPQPMAIPAPEVIAHQPAATPAPQPVVQQAAVAPKTPSKKGVAKNGAPKKAAKKGAAKGPVKKGK